MNPIQKLKEWFDSEPKEVQDQLAFMGFYLPTLNPIPEIPPPPVLGQRDKEIADEPSDRMITLLNTNAESNAEEIVLKAMTIFSLFDATISKMDNEADWDEAVNNNIETAARLKEKNINTAVEDAFFENLDHRKKLWFEVGRRWNNFKNSNVSPKLIIRWWHDTAIERIANRRGY
jgi:hypothetical protein